MEQPFSTAPSAASLFNFSPSSGPGQHQSGSPFSLSQQPSTGVPHTIRIAASLPRHYPSALAFPALQQALGGGSASVRHFLSNPSSPDPPASGPTSPPMASSTRASIGSAAAASAAPLWNSAAATARRPSATRRTRRHCPPGTAVVPLPGASILESPSLAPREDAKPAPRRSTRARKRAPAAVKTEDTADQPAKKRRGNLKSPPPGSVKVEPSDDSNPEDEEEVKTASCCICMDEPKPADLASISGCDHLFCFECIEKWAERENTCPLCKVRFAKIDRVNKARKKGGPKNTKRVKQKDQRSDIAPGAALEGLLASFAASANLPPHRVARLIFSGGNPFMMPGASAMRSARAAGASAEERANALEDSLFSSDTDDEDDDSFLPTGNSAGPSFHDLFRVGGPFGTRSAGPRFFMGANGGIHVGPPMPAGVARHAGAAARSYATNGDDQNAGRQATNPLEIDDDSDDGEEIEILQVTRPL